MSFKLFRQIKTRWREVQERLRWDSGLVTVAIVSLTVTGVALGTKQVGWFEPLELQVYDRLLRLRPDQGSDPRILIVAITEDDIQRQQRSTPSDQDLATAIEHLSRYRPRVIGLDLHRDVPQPPGTDELRRVIQSLNVVVITKLGNEEESSIPPPPGVAPDQVGFNDFLIDRDGVIRRNLLFGSASGQTYYSFSLRLALTYLAPLNITPKPSAIPDHMQLGSAVFVPLERQSGGYQTNDNRGYQILLNYRSSRHAARKVSFTEVLNNQLDPAWVKDKIIMIGTTAISGKDLFYTPYSAGEQNVHKMSGVEIHAQSVSQILEASLNQRPLMWFWVEWQEWLWIGLWTLVGGSLGWCIRHPLLLALGGVGAMIVLSSTCFILLLHQGWVPLLTPGIAFLLSAITVVTYRAQQAHRQQQMVMTLLGQNTSPEIANALWDARDRLTQSGKLPGQWLIATMLFTDIRGFSSVAEQMSPEELLEWLNEYLEAMTQVIQSHHGIVNKFTGDGLLAVFGVPIPQEELTGVAQDACRAVSCALTMGDRLEQLNQEWQEQGLSKVQMRVGIFTGPVVVGSLGGRDRMEYGVIGDSVNTASRLESCLKERQPNDCRILIAQETLDYIDGHFLVESWGPMTLRGKQHLVEVYRVISYAEDSSPESESFSYTAETKLGK